MWSSDVIFGSVINRFPRRIFLIINPQPGPEKRTQDKYDIQVKLSKI